MLGPFVSQTGSANHPFGGCADATEPSDAASGHRRQVLCVFVKKETCGFAVIPPRVDCQIGRYHLVGNQLNVLRENAAEFRETARHVVI